MSFAGLNSFEETYKTAYSHGLEAIYSLEHIDIKSIRLLATVDIPKKEPAKKVAAQKRTSSEQLEMDFGSPFRMWIMSSVLQEPIQVLELSRYTEKSLLNLGNRFLGDLVKIPQNEWLFLKGLGQSHISEVREKLDSYLENKPLQHSPVLDFESWLRVICRELPTKKVVLFMELYNLEQLFPLNSAEMIELRRLNPEIKDCWIQEVDEGLKECKQNTLGYWKEAMEALVKPWIRHRLGMATPFEVLERIYQISVDSALVERMLAFLAAVYGEKTLMEPFLYTSSNVYFADASVKDSFHLVEKTAHSYFTQASVSYPFTALVVWISRELARRWIGFPEGFVEKVLKSSQAFRLRQSPSCQLEVSLNR